MTELHANKTERKRNLSPKVEPEPPPVTEESPKKKNKKVKKSSSPNCTSNEPQTPETPEAPETHERTPKPVSGKKRKNKKSEEPGTQEEPEVKDPENDDESQPTSKKRRRHSKKKPVGFGFTLLGQSKKGNVGKARRHLPNWLANPTVITSNLHDNLTKVDSLKCLDSVLVEGLKKNGVLTLFPVQAGLVPFLIGNTRGVCRPRDVCVSAPTGSGKTLAFVLPIIQALKSRVVYGIRAVVVLPVKDLAIQVASVFEAYGKLVGLNVALIVGQHPLEKEQQSLVRRSVAGAYQSRVDIVVATPGRLVDHIHYTPGLTLKHLRYIVIDEADRIMSNLTQDWLSILQSKYNTDKGLSDIFLQLNAINLPSIEKQPQKLLFSATLSQDPEKLQQMHLFQPKLFTTFTDFSDGSSLAGETDDFIGKYTTPEELREMYSVCDAALKPLCLLKVVLGSGYKRVLCFTNSVESAQRLTVLLNSMAPELKPRHLSAHIHPRKRVRLLKLFSGGGFKLLISSDALARGIDVPDVDCVVSYDLPPFVKTYIHRVGRTARAGKEGHSIVFLLEQELRAFWRMMDQSGKSQLVKEMKFDQSELSEWEGNYKESLRNLGSIVKRQEMKSQSSWKRKKMQKGRRKPQSPRGSRKNGGK